MHDMVTLQHLLMLLLHWLVVVAQYALKALQARKIHSRQEFC